MSTVAVIDYGMGNLRSVVKALEHVAPRASVRLVAEPAGVRAADRVVFPGQGAMAGAMQALTGCKMLGAIHEALETRPFLGICLGLQMLYKRSDEGGEQGTTGLGVIPGTVRRFPADMIDPDTGERLKVPHMGWNSVSQTRAHPLWEGIADETRFYFVHSFYADTSDREVVTGVSSHGLRFTSAAARDNIFAVQFHPEKSQHAGLRLLENFMRWDGQA